MDLFPWGGGGGGGSWQNCRERRRKIVFQSDRREGISLCKNRNGFSPFWKMSGHCLTQSSSWSSSLSLCSNNKCVYSKCRHLSECLSLVYVVHVPIELSRNNTVLLQRPTAQDLVPKFVLLKITGSFLYPSFLPYRSKGACVWMQIFDISHAAPQI